MLVTDCDPKISSAVSLRHARCDRSDAQAAANTSVDAPCWPRCAGTLWVCILFYSYAPYVVVVTGG
jgi:hypothetical protein